VASEAAQRVQEALAARGAACKVVELPARTRTALEAATAIGCHVEQIVKSLVFRTTSTGRPVLVLASGANRVDEGTVGKLVGESITKADAAFVRTQTGFVIGGVPPLGHPVPLPTLLDEDLLRYGEVWAAAGTPHAVFAITPAELVAVTGGQVAPVGRSPA
jgi:prolyl-tRNA editing enzyme YbaK/EbsC (Cys-tRNA(Pro) deacylase)